jgi:hypothetical protein
MSKQASPARTEASWFWSFKLGWTELLAWSRSHNWTQLASVQNTQDARRENEVKKKRETLDVRVPRQGKHREERTQPKNENPKPVYEY